MADDDRPLSPASHEDLVERLAYALRYSRSGKRVHNRDSVTAEAAAQHLAEMLALSGFVFMKKPPSRAPRLSTSAACAPLRPQAVQAAAGVTP